MWLVSNPVPQVYIIYACIIIVGLTTHKHCVSACTRTSYRCCAIYIVAARCALIFPDSLAGLKSSWTAVQTASRRLYTRLDCFKAIRLKPAGRLIIRLDGLKTVLRLTIGPKREHPRCTTNLYVRYYGYLNLMFYPLNEHRKKEKKQVWKRFWCQDLKAASRWLFNCHYTSLMTTDWPGVLACRPKLSIVYLCAAKSIHTVYELNSTYVLHLQCPQTAAALHCTGQGITNFSSFCVLSSAYMLSLD